MVEIVTGAGLGLLRDSASVLGSQGQVGSAALGQGGDQVTVNAANGNLVIQSVDEMLIGTGPDDIIANTYNSQGTLGNGWQASFQRRVVLSATDSSKVTHYAADGSDIVYTYDGIAKYVGNEQDGAYDTLTFNSTNNQWTWTEAKSRTVEIYDAANGGRLLSTTDIDGNALIYAYDGSGRVAKITTTNEVITNGTPVRANGEYTKFIYNTDETVIETHSSNDALILTRARYTYDAGRLIKTTVDLTPNDNSATDSNTYVTSYAYDNGRISTISQSDGSNLQIVYVQVGSTSTYQVAKLIETQSTGIVATTNFSYASGRTIVTDPQGNITTFVYDANNQLTQLISPPTAPGAPQRAQSFGYDANGNLLYAGPTGDPNFTNLGLNWNDTTTDGGVSWSRSVEVDGGISVYRRQTVTGGTQPSPSAGWKMRLGQSLAPTGKTGGGLTVVRPGQRVQASVYAASSGASSLTLYAIWRDANGTPVGTSASTPIATGGVIGANGLTLAKFSSLTATAPSGAVYVELMVQGVADGSGQMNIAIAQPSVVVSGAVTDANFTDIAENWSDTWNTALPAGLATTQNSIVTGGVNVYQRLTTSSSTPVVIPAAGWAMNLGQPGGEATAVSSGQTVQASVYVSSTHARKLTFLAQWLDANGNGLGNSVLSTVTTGGNFSSGLTGGKLGAGSATAPVGAAKCYLTVQAEADGLGQMDISIAQPTILVSGTIDAGPVTDSNFTNLAANWTNTWLSSPPVTTPPTPSVSAVQSTEIDGGVSVYRRQTTTTPFVGCSMNLGQSWVPAAGAWTAVAAGQTVQASVYVASSGASSVRLIAEWFDATGNGVGALNLSDVDLGGILGTGGLANAKFASGRGTAPAGAAYVTLTVQAIADGSGPMNVAIAQPTIAVSGIGNGGSTLDGTFANRAGDWNNVWNTQTTPPILTSENVALESGVNVYRRNTSTTTPPVDWTMNMGQSVQGRTPATAGQPVQASVYVASTGAKRIDLWATWYDANGTEVSGTILSSIAGGGDFTSGVASAKLASGTWVTPVGAAYVLLTVQAIADGMAPLNVAIAQPTIAIGGGMDSTPAPAFNYTYDSKGNLLTQTDSLGNATFNVYDANNQLLTRTIYPTASGPLTSRYVYDSLSHLRYAISPVGEVTQYVYDTLGQQKQITQYTSAADIYNISGLATTASPSLTTMNNWAAAPARDLATTHRTDMDYDSRGAVSKVTTYSQTNTDGTGGSVASVTDYTHDQAGLLTKRILSGVGAATASETFEYDGLGRVTRTFDFAVKKTETVYSNTGTGAKAVLTMADGTTKTSVYDLAGDLISELVVGAGIPGATTTYAYDANGNLIRVKDPTGVSSYFVYDALGRKVADVTADGAITAYTYNAANQVIVSVAYGEKLSATQIALLAGADATMTVSLANVTPEVSASDRWNWNIFDFDGKLIETINAQGEVTAYAYDGADRLVSTTEYATALSAAMLASFRIAEPIRAVLPGADAGNDRTTRNFYDADGRLACVLDAEGYLTRNIYDGAGEMVHSIAYKNKPTATATLQDLTSTVTSSSEDIHNWNIYDDAGRLLARIDGEGTITRYEDYTAAGYAATVKFGEVTSTATLIAKPLTTWPSLADLAATGTPEVTTYTYDFYGHVLTKVLTPATGTETTTYTYDAVYNLIKQSTLSSTTAAGTTDSRAATIKYNGLGQKIATLSGIGSAALAALGATPTQAQIDLVWASYGVDYAYDPAGRLISQMDADGNRTLFYYDIAGRLTYEVDATGAVVKYDYNVFGETTDVTHYVTKIAATTLTGLSGGQVVAALTSAIVTNVQDSHSHTDYDALGIVADTIDALGAVTSYDYNAFGELTNRIDPRIGAYMTGVMSKTTQTYNRRGLLMTSTADATGLALATTYDYDAFGRAQKVTDANGSIESSTYYRNGLVKSQTDALNKSTAYTYDAFGRVSSITDRASGLTNYSYNPFDRQIIVTNNPAGAVTTTKNAYGQTVKIVDGATTTTTFDYDLDGNLITTTVDPGTSPHLNLITRYAYDNAGNLISTTDPELKVTRYIYDADNRKAYSIDPLGSVTGYSYDDESNVTRTVQYAVPYPSNLTGVQTLGQMQNWAAPNDSSTSNLSTRIIYDAAGQQAFNIDTTGLVTGYTYDTTGQLIQSVQYATTFPAGTTGVQTLGQMQTWVAPYASSSSNLTTRFLYDGAGRTAITIDATGSVIGYTYDADGHVIQQVAYYNTNTSSTIQYLADIQPWLTSNSAVAGNRTTRFVYDVAGRKAYAIDSTNAVTGYSYDNEGRVTKTVAYYNSCGLTGIPDLTAMNGWVSTSASAANDLKTTAGYDAAGRLFYSIDAGGFETSYLYDGNGRVTQETHYTTSYAQVPGTLPADALTTRHVYDAAGREAYTIDAAGAVTAYTYDGNGRVKTMVQYAVTYLTTGVRNQTNMKDWVASNVSNPLTPKDRTTYYLYDDAGRLTQITDPRNVLTHFDYDTLGRKTARVDAHTTFDAVVTLWNTGERGLVSMVRTALTSADEASVQYSYDAFGRIYTMIDGNKNVTSYEYDADGRITKTIKYAVAYGGTDMPNQSTMQAWVSNSANTVGSVSTINQYNAFGELVKVTDPNGNAGYFYYDTMGRQTYQVDALGYMTKTDYDFAGQVQKVTRYATAVTGSLTTATQPTVTPNAADNVTSFERDTLGRVTKSTDGNGQAHLDSNGQPIPAKWTSYSYDSFGNQKTMTNAAGGVVTYSYDGRGRMTSQTTPASNVLDAANNPIAPAVTTGYIYDAFGNRTQVIEGQGLAKPRTTTYEYDKDNNLIKQTGDAVTVTSSTGATSTVVPIQEYVYDQRGNQVGTKDANGGVTLTYYDDQNRKAFQVSSVGTLTAWTYDDNGNMLSQKVYGDALSVPTDPHPATNASGYILPVPVNASNYRETDYSNYDQENRLRTTKVLNVKTGTGDTAGVWTSTTGDLTTSIIYDSNGNVIKETDANTNSTYTYYDKIGRKIAQVDAGNYLTTYDLDAEGNVKSQTQYANKISGTPPLGGTPPPTPAVDGDDRTTSFTYDHNGQRLSETREGAVYYTVSGNSVTQVDTSVDLTPSKKVTVGFTYNSLGQVLTKTEATGEYTNYEYDTLGRVAKMTTAANDSARALTTLTTYDFLGNVLTTVAGFGTTTTETTSYTYDYDHGGRLTKVTDATLFDTNYGYDANGQTTVQSWARVKSDGTVIDEAVLTTYDKLGHAVSTVKASRAHKANPTDPQDPWTIAATTDDTFYNTFGEVIARGTRMTNDGTANPQRNIDKMQEFADYDNAGRMWRGNMGDGVTKVFGYDRNGNMTLQLQSLGATDLRNVATIDAALTLMGTTNSGLAKTINIYDKRNQLVDVLRPNNVNADGSITSTSTVGVGQTGTATVTWTNIGTPSSFTNTIKVEFSSLALTSEFGTGQIHLALTAEQVGATPAQSQILTLTAGSTAFQPYTFTFPPTASGPPTRPNVTVRVYQDSTPTGSQIDLVALQSFTATSVGTSTQSIPLLVGSSFNFQVADTTATSLKMYVRQSGSTSNYAPVDATQVKDANGVAIPGWFTLDAYKPPFNWTNGAAWDVKYVAKNAASVVVEARGGKFSYTGNNPAIPSVDYFDAVPFFDAGAPINGLCALTDRAPTIGFTDTKQSFNAFGDVVSQTDAYGKTTNFSYNDFGNLTQKTAPTVTVVGENGVGTPSNPTDIYYYDKSGRLIGHLDANLNLTTQKLVAGTGYGGSEGLIDTQYNPNGGGTTSNTYDIFGNVKTQTDATGVVTYYDYDLVNRLITVTHPDRGSDTYSVGTGSYTKLIDHYVYDGLGQRIKHWNNVFGSGTNETTDYDLQGRVVKSVSFASQQTTYDYTWYQNTGAPRPSAGVNAGYWQKKTTTAAGFTLNSTDYFGKATDSQDLGARLSHNAYNLAGQITRQTNLTTGQSIYYTYTATGQVARIADTFTKMTSAYAYDNNGNRIAEDYYGTGSNPTVYEKAAITYDVLNRVTEYKDAKADITYSYDANGNRREMKSVYTQPGTSGNLTQDYWYKYDTMNRFVLTKGTLTGSGTTAVIGAGADGVVINYNNRGERTIATYGTNSGSHVETYSYSADGYLETVTSGGALSVTRYNDLLGRLKTYKEFLTDGTISATTALTRDGITYDGDNRVTGETDTTRLTDGTTNSTVITNDYKAYTAAVVSGTHYNGADKGVLTHTKSVLTPGSGSVVTTNTDYNYVWWSGAKSDTVVSSNGATTGTSTYGYDANGNLTGIVDSGASRTLSYVNDAFGQVLIRKETNGATRTFLYLNGKAVGDIGNDKLASSVDYAQQLATDRNMTNQATSPGTQIVAYNANFDASYQAYNPANIDQSGSSYTVTGGESLQTIAMNVWGDSSLWYMLADANGLDAGATLVAGQSLIVPGKVSNFHNTTSTFKPYNPSDTLGDTSPTQPHPPAPKQHGCGVVGQVLVAIVAIVVVAIVAPYAMAAVANLGVAGTSLGTAVGTAFASTATGSLVTGAMVTAGSVGFTAAVAGGAIAGLAGGIASQGFAVATGIQSRFDWSAVAMGAIAGGVGGGFAHLIGGSGFIAGMERGLATSVVSQGVDMAVGLQHKFDWTSVAVSGIASGVSAKVGQWAEGHGADATQRGVLVGAAALLAGAATNSALTGQDFGRSIREALPSAIASTVGNLIGDALIEQGKEDYRIKPQADDGGEITPYSLGTGGMLDRDIDESTNAIPDHVSGESSVSGQRKHHGYVVEDPVDNVNLHRTSQIFRTVIPVEVARPAKDHAGVEFSDFTGEAAPRATLVSNYVEHASIANHFVRGGKTYWVINDGSGNYSHEIPVGFDPAGTSETVIDDYFGKIVWEAQSVQIPDRVLGSAGYTAVRGEVGLIYLGWNAIDGVGDFFGHPLQSSGQAAHWLLNDAPGDTASFLKYINPFSGKISPMTLDIAERVSTSLSKAIRQDTVPEWAGAVGGNVGPALFEGPGSIALINSARSAVPLAKSLNEARMLENLASKGERLASDGLPSYWDDYFDAVGKEAEDVSSLTQAAKKRGINVANGESAAYSSGKNATIFVGPDTKRWEFIEEFLHHKVATENAFKAVRDPLKKTLKLQRVQEIGRVAEEISVKKWILNKPKLLGLDEPTKILLQKQIDQLKRYGVSRGY